MKLKVLDIFAGIGGFSLGLERTGGFETVAFCEIDPYCRRVLAKHWPDVPCHDDVQTFVFPQADVITAGFPCQDISGAGKRAGLSGTRSRLFWDVMRAFRMVGCKYILLENVADLLHRGMGDVCGAMASGGLRVEWDCVSARDVGAPHYRDRIWIVAYADARLKPVWAISSNGRRSKGKGKGKGVRRHADADSVRKFQPGWCFSQIWRLPFHGGSSFMGWREHWIDRLGALCRMDDGVSRRLDEAKPLGNGLLPDIPELIGKAILQAEGLSP